MQALDDETCLSDLSYLLIMIIECLDEERDPSFSKMIGKASASAGNRLSGWEFRFHFITIPECHNKLPVQYQFKKTSIFEEEIDSSSESPSSWSTLLVYGIRFQSIPQSTHPVQLSELNGVPEFLVIMTSVSLFEERNILLMGNQEKASVANRLSAQYFYLMGAFVTISRFTVIVILPIHLSTALRITDRFLVTLRMMFIVSNLHTHITKW